jgi:hypothetical protein
MSILSSLSPQTASRLMTVLVVGSLSAAGAGAWTAAMVTGSTQPSDWVAAYEHGRSCSSAGSDQDPNCSTTAAQQLTEQQVAQLLEDRARQLREEATSQQAAPAEPHSGRGTSAVASVSTHRPTNANQAESEAGDD